MIKIENLAKSREQEITAYHWLLFSLCVVVYLTGGTISSLVSVYLPVIVRDLLGDASDAKLSETGPYINAAFLFGMTFGGLTLGMVSDRIGRVWSLAISAVLSGLFTWLIVFVQDWHWLVVSRFLAGMGVAGILLITTVFIAEEWPDKSRAVMQGILSVAFPVGIVLSGGLNVQFSEWRQAFWLGMIPMAAALLMLLFLKESGAWKTARLAEKTGIRKLFSGENGSRLITGILVYGSVLIGLWAVFSWLPTWVNQLFPEGTDAGRERGQAMMSLGMSAIMGSALSGFLVNRFGLRSTLLLTFAACFALCALLFLTNHVFLNIIYIETAVLGIFFGISQGALSVYITELFPTVIRATSTGLCFNMGRIFTASAVFFVGSLVGILGGFGNAIFIFSFAFLIAFAALKIRY